MKYLYQGYKKALANQQKKSYLMVKKKKSVRAGAGATEQCLCDGGRTIPVRAAEMRLAAGANQCIWELQILKSQMRCHYILYALKIFRSNNIKCRRRHGEIRPSYAAGRTDKIPLWRS